MYVVADTEFYKDLITIYGHLMVLNINADNSMAWYQKVPRFAWGKDRRLQYASFYNPVSDRVSVLVNGGPFSDDASYFCQLDENGALDRQEIFKNKTRLPKNIVLIPNLSVKVSDNEIIGYGEEDNSNNAFKKSKFKFCKVSVVNFGL